MRRFLILLIFVISFCFSVRAEAKKFALLVGVDEYESAQSLQCCVNDVTMLGTALMKAGFKYEEIEILKTGGSLRELPTKKKMEQKVDEILAEAKSSDVVLFVFSGYGAQDGKKTYFCPPDMDAKDLEGTCFSFTKMMRALSKCPAKNKWVVVDAARIDPAQKVKEFGGKALHFIPTPPAGIMLFQSCSDGEASMIEYDTRKSFFMKNLATALSGEADVDLDGMLTLKEVIKWTAAETKSEVEIAKNKVQKPVSSGSFQDYTLMEDPNVPKAKKLAAEAKEAMEAENYALAIEKYNAALSICPKFTSWKRERDNAQNLLDTKKQIMEEDVSEDEEVKPVNNIPAGTRKVVTVDGVKYAFRWCPPGEFMMGAAHGEKDTEAVHKVKLTQGFWLLETEVTQKMWQSIMGKNPSYFKGNKHPVEKISRGDCQEFCGKLSLKMGQTIKLPTEAQWEYACRAGEEKETSQDFYGIAWYSDNSDSKTQQVGTKEPNAWGLYDMHGNVAEWCSDYYDSQYYATSPMRNPENTTVPESSNGRRVSQNNQYSVCRGGSWRSNVKECRSTYRGKGLWNYRTNYLGLRVVMLDDSEIPAKETVAKSGEEPSNRTTAKSDSVGSSNNLSGNSTSDDSGTVAGARKVVTVDGIEYAFRWCPPGEFMMGGERYETTNSGMMKKSDQHHVKLTKGFWLLETEVTQAMWQSVMGTDPSGYKGKRNPVEHVTWEACTEFCRKLSQKLGRKVQLPTEAQWEYACRAGTTTFYYWGDDEDLLYQYGNYCDRSNTSGFSWQDKVHSDGYDKTAPVGSFKPNPWGLYDMSGNVWEWCSDYYDVDYYSKSPEIDPENKTYAMFHVVRGGCWDYLAKYCRSAHRDKGHNITQKSIFGFRILMGTSDEPSTQSEPDDVGKDISAGARKIITVDGVMYAFRWCPPGEFMMGGEALNKASNPVHKVILTKGFWLLETEVTQEMWINVMGSNPSEFKGYKNPVEQVSWDDTQEFCRKLSEKMKQKIDLPTEAQWEYACRAGATGDSDGKIDEMAWHQGNSDSKTQQIGLKKPNAWGLYDMRGNIWEWCSDYFGSYSASTMIDPTGSPGSSFRIVRGGCWREGSYACLFCYRGWGRPDSRTNGTGFRILLVPGTDSSDKQSTGLKSDSVPGTSSISGETGNGLAAGARKVLTSGGIEYAFRWCPPGEFMMGGGKLENEPVHKVKLTKGFWMLETEVTQAMWESVMGENPSEFKGSLNPVEKVTWEESREFCRKLKQKLGQPVQLPTEAQWEYACRAGSTTEYCWGDNGSLLWQYGNYCERSNTNNPPWQDRDHTDGYDRTAPVGSFKPNAWGLYDMHGNVWEWCADYFDDDYYTKSPMYDPKNTTVSPQRVIRGSAWFNGIERCRSANRGRGGADGRADAIGLRVVLAFGSDSSDDQSTESTPDNVNSEKNASSGLKSKSGDTGNGLAAGTRKVLIVGGIKYAFRWCPPGEFMMGWEKWDNELVHKVKLTKGFWMLETEVTQAMWESVMGENPSEFRNDRNPVEKVSWEDSQEFCRKLSLKLRRQIQLPTEAQWEYACRAGSVTEYCWGDSDDLLWQYGNYCDKSNTINVSWKDQKHDDGYDKTSPVGSFKPNAWGLYDMHGNVWEWCSDWYDPNYYYNSPKLDPENRAPAQLRVLRGGSWIDVDWRSRSPVRGRFSPGDRDDHRGLRVIMVPDPDSPEN